MFEELKYSSEKWKDIPGFEGYYQISDLGRVKSVERVVRDRKLPAKIIKSSGVSYQSVGLWKDNKGHNFLVHRLVAQAFLPNPDNLPEVDHKDGDVTNNKVDNLEWVTASDNHLRKIQNKSKKKTSYRRSVKCLETGEIFTSISAAGRSVNADATQIVESIQAQRCCKGSTFAYADDLPQDEKAYVEQAHAKYQTFHKRPNMKNARKVRCVETGQEFDSIAAAARFYNCDTATINNRIKSKRTVEGATLEYVEVK